MATELERRIVAIEVTGEQKAVHAYERVTAAGDKMTKGATSFASGIGAVNSKLGALATGGAGIFRALTSGAGGAAGAIVGLGATFVSAVGGLAMSAVKTLVSWLATATKMALGLAAAGTAVGIAFTKAAIGAAIQRDTAMRSLTSLMGAGPAQQHFGDLRNVAKLPGMDLNSVMQFSRGLQAVNVNAETTLRLLRAIGNALALSGKGPQELGRVGIQLQQMFAKGKVMAEDVIIVSESLPQFRQAIKDAFGTSDTEALIKRGLTATEILAGVVGQLEKLPKATTGPANALVNLRMAWDDLLVSFGQAFAQAGGIEVINKLADGLAKLAPVMAQVGQQAAAVLPALGAGIEKAFALISNPDTINKWAKAAVAAMASVASWVYKLGPGFVQLARIMAAVGTTIATFFADLFAGIAKAGQKLGIFNEETVRAVAMAGNSVVTAGEEMTKALNRLAKSADDWASKGLANVTKWQNAASAAIDKTTEALKAQANAVKEVANQYGRVVSMGQLAALQSPGTPQMAGAQAYISAFQSRGPLGYGSVAGSMTPEQHEANWKANAELLKAQAREQSRLSIEREMAARAENSQQLANTVRSQYGSSMSDTLNSMFAAIRDYQQGAQMAEWGQKFGMPYMLQRGFEVGRDAMARGSVLGLAPSQMMSGGQLPYYVSELAIKLLGGKQKADAKENRAVTIEGDYRAQRERERMSLNDRLAQQVIGNLGAGDQGILSQAKLGQQADAMTIAARRAGTDIGAMIADAIGYALPKAVEATVARRLRLDYQGAN